MTTPAGDFDLREGDVRADLVLGERGSEGIDELNVAQVLEDFTPAGLAAALAVVAVTEYARLVRLRGVDVGLLLALGVLYPVAGMAASVAVGSRTDRRIGLRAAAAAQR